MLTQLIEDWQDVDDPEAIAAVEEWMKERDQLRSVKFRVITYSF